MKPAFIIDSGHSLRRPGHGARALPAPHNETEDIPEESGPLLATDTHFLDPIKIYYKAREPTRSSRRVEDQASRKRRGPRGYFSKE